VSETLDLSLRSSIFDRQRRLTITPTYLEFDDRSSVGLEPTRFKKEEMEGLRYGVKPIEGYQFVIGRIYCIDIRNNQGRTMKIRLKSMYGVNKIALAQKFAKIVNIFLDYFFDDISRGLLEKFHKGESFSLLGVSFFSDGVNLKKDGQLIKWVDLGTQSYTRYYAMYSKWNPNHYKAFEYLVDWNTATLYSVSREILKEKGFWSKT